MSQDYSVKALFPILDTKRGNSSSQLGEVLLDNHSSLLAPCSSRKRKSLTIENVATQLIEVSKDHSFGEKKFKINGSSLIVNLVKLECSVLKN